MGSKRYCVSAHDIRHLQHEGLGWGHDLDHGCLTLETIEGAGSGRVRRIIRRILGQEG